MSKKGTKGLLGYSLTKQELHIRQHRRWARKHPEYMPPEVRAGKVDVMDLPAPLLDEILARFDQKRGPPDWSAWENR